MRTKTVTLFLLALAAINLLPLGYMLALGGWGPTHEGGVSTAFGPLMELWRTAPRFTAWMGNSAAISLLTVGFHLIADSMAGFVLAKRSFRGRSMILAGILLAMMIPRQVTLIPLFLGMAHFDLADRFLGLFLPGLGDAVGIFLMRQFFLSLPDSLLDAARIDGASEWQTFTQIALPLARPALGVLAVLSFQHYWSDFFWPLVITQSPEHYTLPVGLAFLTRTEFGPNLPLMAAGATVAAVPVLLMFLALRGIFFDGFRGGALKE